MRFGTWAVILLGSFAYAEIEQKNNLIGNWRLCMNDPWKRRIGRLPDKAIQSSNYHWKHQSMYLRWEKKTKYRKFNTNSKDIWSITDSKVLYKVFQGLQSRSLNLADLEILWRLPNKTRCILNQEYPYSSITAIINLRDHHVRKHHKRLKDSQKITTFNYHPNHCLLSYLRTPLSWTGEIFLTDNNCNLHKKTLSVP